MMKVLIIGGAGYIGSVTSLYFLNSGEFEVCIFDSLEKSDIKVIRDLEGLQNSKINFIKGDIRNKKDLEKVFSEFSPEIVLNFAGYKSVAEGEVEKEKYTENNIIGNRNILEMCIKFKVRRFIFSSSAATYGKAEYLPIDESHIQRPINHYGYTKLQTELDMKKYSEDYGLECVAFRYFNAVGAHPSNLFGEDSIHCANLIPVIFNTLLGKRKETLLYGDKFNTKDGSQERDYIDVCDLAQAHLLSAKFIMKNKFEAFNLSTCNPVSCKTIIDISEKISNIKLNYRVVEPRQGDPEVIFASNQKAKQELNWGPKISIEESISNAWNFCLKNNSKNL